MASFQCTFGVSLGRTTADQTNGPVFHSHIHQKTPATNSTNNGSRLTGLNEASEAAAITAGRYFFIDITCKEQFEYALTQIAMQYSKTNAQGGNYAIKLATGANYKDIAYSSTIASGTIPSSGTTQTVTSNVTAALESGPRNRIFIVIWGFASSAYFVVPWTSTVINGTWLDNRAYAGYPATLDTFRDIANRPGVVYTPANETSVYAEDQLFRSEAIKKIEAAIGLNPTRLQSNVSDSVLAQGFAPVTGYFKAWHASGGAMLDWSEPEIFATASMYLIRGYVFAAPEDSTVTWLELETEIDDFAYFGGHALIETFNDGPTPIALTAWASSGRIRFAMPTGNYGTDGGIEDQVMIFIPRLTEGWQQAPLAFQKAW